jgi:hypothetical protein
LPFIKKDQQLVQDQANDQTPHRVSTQESANRTSLSVT